MPLPTSFLRPDMVVRVTGWRTCQSPRCDEVAAYDMKTPTGPWGNFCTGHAAVIAGGTPTLGTGRGQFLFYLDPPHAAGQSAPCYACGAHWAGHLMVHLPGCFYTGAQDLEAQVADDDGED